MLVSKKKYRKKIGEAVNAGFDLGKLYIAAKIYKEITEGTTMTKLTRACQDILHKGDTEF